MVANWYRRGNAIEKLQVGRRNGGSLKTWRAVCGVDGSTWKAENRDNNPAPSGSFCPDCKSRGMTAPGVLHWVAE